MQRTGLLAAVVFGTLVVGACQRTESKLDQTRGKGSGAGVSAGSGSGAAARPKTGVEQVPAPVDLKTPPADATTTPSGLIYKKLSTAEGPSPGRNDTVQILYTGWKQSTGETFYTTKNRGQPIPLQLASAAPGFTEGLQLLKQGEKAMMWIPPSIGYKTPPQGKPETLVYEVELVSIIAAPAIPADVAAPPATARVLKSGARLVTLRPGTGTDKARSFDTVTFNFTAWDKDGKMFDSTEVRKRPATLPPFRQSAVLEEVLTSMQAGERVRMWVEAGKLQGSGKPVPGAATDLVCYEVELLTIDKAKGTPPPAPADVAAPPAGAKTTQNGVAYKVLSAGKGGTKPTPKDRVKVHYTGWTTNGRMFDSSIVKGQPAEFSLGGVIAGWTEGLQVMAPGDKVRFWIPEQLAYKGTPGRPQGMLVFDIDLLEVTAGSDDPHASMGGAGATLPAPADVAAPPKDAKKSPKGVFYKILKTGKGGPKPTAEDTITMNYTGWTTDGKMFDSSVTRGEPLVYPLRQLIPGWIDAVPLLSVGDSARLWIPVELAYNNAPGSPQGMLVFDVELLDFKSAK